MKRAYFSAFSLLLATTTYATHTYTFGCRLSTAPVTSESAKKCPECKAEEEAEAVAAAQEHERVVQKFAAEVAAEKAKAEEKERKVQAEIAAAAPAAAQPTKPVELQKIEIDGEKVPVGRVVKGYEFAGTYKPTSADATLILNPDGTAAFKSAGNYSVSPFPFTWWLRMNSDGTPMVTKDYPGLGRELLLVLRANETVYVEYNGHRTPDVGKDQIQQMMIQVADTKKEIWVGGEYMKKF